MKTTAFVSAFLALPFCCALAPVRGNNASLRTQGTELEMARSVGKLSIRSCSLASLTDTFISRIACRSISFLQMILHVMLWPPQRLAWPSWHRLLLPVQTAVPSRPRTQRSPPAVPPLCNLAGRSQSPVASILIGVTLEDKI